MAYAAAISLKSTLRRFHPNPYFMHLYRLATSIQNHHFKGNDLEEKCLEKEIRDALYRAENILESYMLRNLLSPEDLTHSSRNRSHTPNLTQQLIEAIQQIDFNKQRMDKFSEENSILDSTSTFVFPLTDDFPPVHKKKMVGLDGELARMKKVILGEYTRHHFLGAIGIYGMGGIGKTSLAISIYNDLDIRSHFSVGAWVKISLQHSVRSILLSLWHTMEFFDSGRVKDINESIMIEEMDDEELADLVCAFFLTERYIVIVDCLCDINLSSWNYIKSMLPDSKNGSRILLVSRLELNPDPEIFLGRYTKAFLNGSESWNLLEQQVFGFEPCPNSALERIGKKIAENCQGLPLAIIAVGIHLAKKEKTVEYWNKVAKSGNSVAYEADGELLFEKLGLSYSQMPPSFRTIFLYLGAFPERPLSPLFGLMKLWEAEVLVDLEEFGNVVPFSSEATKYLVERNLIILINEENRFEPNMGLHPALWHFCCNQAKKEEFFHVFDEYINDGEDSNINSKLRRIVIRKAVLFGINEFVEKIEHSILSVHSMLFTGPYHTYPLTMISWGCYKMLRVLNACSIRFYEFPREILDLRLLCYLFLTLNGGNLPPGISMLRNLETLIVRFHHIVRSWEGDPSYLPIEIWEMRQLRHLQVMGCDLPVPPHSDAFLLNLVTLLDVSPYSCTKEVLERIPNLAMVKIGINFAPKRNSVPMCLFDHTVALANLKAVNVVITNGYFEENTAPQVAMPKSFSFSMKNLISLRLSGCGFPWESIEPISELPLLEVLELRSHAFRGPKWELASTGFSRLQFLHLENLDLVYWTTRSGNHFFPCLQIISIITCHKLERIPLNFVYCRDIIAISVLDSSREAEAWARSIHMELSKTRRRQLIVASQRGETSRSQNEFVDE